MSDLWAFSTPPPDSIFHNKLFLALGSIASLKFPSPFVCSMEMVFLSHIQGLCQSLRGYAMANCSSLRARENTLSGLEFFHFFIQASSSGVILICRYIMDIFQLGSGKTLSWTLDISSVIFSFTSLIVSGKFFVKKRYFVISGRPCHTKNGQLLWLVLC